MTSSPTFGQHINLSEMLFNHLPMGIAGYADRARRYPVTLEHHFRIGSVSKLYTAAPTMQQVEEGLISLEASISQ